MKKISNLRKSINYTFNNGLADSAIKAFTSGNLVTAFALALGANSIIIGLLQSVQPLANFVHIVVAYFIEKGANLKKISFWCSLISRPFWLITGCVAFFADSTIALYIFCISYFLAYFIATATGGAFWPWIKELVPHKIMNNFLAFRIKYILIVRIICGLFVSGLLYLVQKYYPQYSIYSYTFLFLIAFLLGLYATYTLTKIDNKPVKIEKNKNFALKMWDCLKNRSFQSLLIGLGSIQFSINFITPFLMVFMMKKLEISVSMALLITTFSQFIDAYSLKWWNKKSKNNTSTAPLKLALIFYIIVATCFIALNYVNNDYAIYIILGIAYTFLGLASAGLNLATSDIAIIYIPHKMSSIYISINNSFRFLCAASGPICAGLLLTFLENNWTSYFIISIIVIIISVCMIKMIKPVKE